jgi:hypothetical protein
MPRITPAFLAVLLACANAVPAQAQTDPTPTGEVTPDPVSKPTQNTPPSPPDSLDQLYTPPAAAPVSAATAVSSEVSIVGDFRYESNFKTQDPALDRLGEHETELAITGYLSPWTRADFFLSHHEQALELEEGFLTLTSLPYDLKGRVGKFKMPFGKLNPVHPEGWVFVNPPLAMLNILGSDEGWNDKAVEISGFVPLPIDWLTTATVSASNGDGATTLKRGPMGSLRLTTFAPISDEAGLELGLSGASQVTPPVAGMDRRSLLGADARYRWRPNSNTSFTLLGEAMGLAQASGVPWGAYLSADYQFLTDHDIDLRLDRSDLANEQGILDGTAIGTAASITYGLSLFETTRFKIQFQHTLAPAPEERVIAQTVFVLGPHKHALNF